MIDRNLLIRRLAFAGYFIAAFLLFLLLLFPFDRVKQKLESEFRQRTNLELTVSRISPRFFNRYVLSDVVISDKKGKVVFESRSVNASVSLFSLLRGGLSIKMKADAYGGAVLMKAQQSTGRRYLLLDADALDIALYPMLKELGVRLTGKLGGNFEMNGDSGKGRLWVKGVTSRELKIQGFSIPDFDFEKGWIETELRGDRLMVKKLELEGKEIRIQVAGDLVLHERGTLNLTVKIKPSERLAHEQAAFLSLLKNRDADGYYNLVIGGFVSEPMPRF